VPYKDRETYLRKQREYHARRQARKVHGVSGSRPQLTPVNLHIHNSGSKPVRNPRGVTYTPVASLKPLKPLTPTRPPLEKKKDTVSVDEYGRPVRHIETALDDKGNVRAGWTLDPLGNATRIVK